MRTQSFDGLKTAGRSWRVEDVHSCSVSEANKKEVLEIAEREGWREAIISVNTARLKALLKERANEQGTSSDTPWTKNTDFSGVVSEYVRPVLRHTRTR